MCKHPRAGALVLMLALAGSAYCQGPRPTPPTPPLTGAATPSFRSLVIGPNDSLGAPRKMRGKMTLVASLPSNAKPASVEILLDGKSVGTATTQPFKIEVDTTTVSDGDHTIKAIGRDTSGKEVWTCGMKVSVVNSRDAMTRVPSSVRPGGMPPAPDVALPVQPRNPGNAAKPGKPDRTDRPAKTAKNGKDAKKAGTPLGLDKTYTNDDYGFSIRYPGKWTFADKTSAMKPRTEGGFWIVFAEYPIEKAKLVVNVRRAKLEPGTDAAKYARYNKFVREWESTTALGCPAFCVTDKNGITHQVTHRMIIIKDGYAWMLNCEDSTGKSLDDSRATFEAMVNSIKAQSKGESAAEPRPNRPSRPRDNARPRPGAERPAPPPAPGGAPPVAPPPPPPPVNPPLDDGQDGAE